MSSNDQLTALDAKFLELEQADDSALMHIGGTLVFEPLSGPSGLADETRHEQLLGTINHGLTTMQRRSQDLR